MRRTEQIFVAMVLIGLIMKLVLIPNVTIVVIVALTILAIIYYPFGLFLFNSIRLKKIFKRTSYQGISVLKGIGSFGAGLILSILATGALFKLLYLPGSNVMLGVGLSGSLILLITTAIKYISTKSKFYKNLIVRTLGWTLFSVILFFTSGITLVKVFHRNDPQFIEDFQRNRETSSIKESQHIELQEDSEN